MVSTSSTNDPKAGASTNDPEAGASTNDPEAGASTTGAEVGARVVHRRYVPYSHAHYAGNLVDGAYSLGLFGDVATEMCIVTDGDEGLFASYSDVQFHAAVRAGDVLEITCEISRVGSRSRELRFAEYVVARGTPTPDAPGAARVLAEPILATSATGTVVVPGDTPG